jgi:hypothetical protein
MARGRKTGGMKRGYRYATTRRKARDLELVREMVAAELGSMTEAQIEHAKGVHYMILRMPDGKFARATSVEQIDAACAVGATAFKIFTQTPSTAAFVALMDRAFGKPLEQQRVDIRGSLDIASLLRERYAKRQKALAALGESQSCGPNSRA